MTCDEDVDELCVLRKQDRCDNCEFETDGKGSKSNFYQACDETNVDDRRKRSAQPFVMILLRKYIELFIV